MGENTDLSPAGWKILIRTAGGALRVTDPRPTASRSRATCKPQPRAACGFAAYKLSRSNRRWNERFAKLGGNRFDREVAGGHCDVVVGYVAAHVRRGHGIGPDVLTDCARRAQRNTRHVARQEPALATVSSQPRHGRLARKLNAAWELPQENTKLGVKPQGGPARVWPGYSRRCRRSAGL